MKCGRIIDDPDRYWNIKGLGRFAVFFWLNYLRFMRFERYHLEQIVVPHRHHSWRGMCRRQENHFSQNSIAPPNIQNAFELNSMRSRL
jgi:hypothetical protein